MAWLGWLYHHSVCSNNADFGEQACPWTIGVISERNLGVGEGSFIADSNQNTRKDMSPGAIVTKIFFMVGMSTVGPRLSDKGMLLLTWAGVKAPTPMDCGASAKCTCCCKGASATQCITIYNGHTLLWLSACTWLLPTASASFLQQREEGVCLLQKMHDY